MDVLNFKDFLSNFKNCYGVSRTKDEVFSKLDYDWVITISGPT